MIILDTIEYEYKKILYRRVLLITGIIACIIISGLVDFTLGPSGISIGTLFNTIFSNDVNPEIQLIIFQIRLPYSLMAIIVGLILGLCGAEMQTILNNSLASPFTLGVSSAASFGAAIAIILNIGIPGIPTTWFIPINAFIFALLTALLLDVISRWSKISTSGVILFGVALVFTYNSLVSILQYIATQNTLQDLTLWTMGSITRVSWTKILILIVSYLVILPISLRCANKLTTLKLGEDRAASFGIDIKRLRLTTLLRISFLSAISVAFVGPIGFIGLIAPHISRILIGEDHRYYLPTSSLLGALILSCASIISKNLMPGTIIPIGIITSLVGVPFFLNIIIRNRGLL